ncbi:glycosyltransferase family 2 protein [Puniceicoccus vermicola]|uniref:Glycosyltransferase n=1 Tax=Puniceicoccus vermicola TaxID=388746 RepID=A0A7X1AWP7_9BACT|nr:glycosyltransferase [Puniceicoccus vermicola]MBC2601194.1 glycosyltransferase [Puniceicoccus vermicola]
MYSVVIPTLGLGPYLGEAIDSVLRQTLLPDNIFVVIDGPVPVCLSDLEKSQIVRFIFLGRRFGANAARREGLLKVDSKYVMFLDADDIMRPRKAEVQIEYLERNTEVVAVSCNRGVVINGCVRKETTFSSDYAEKRFHCDNIFGSFSFMCFRRSALGGNEVFDLQMKSFQDYDLYFRIIRNGPIRFLEDVLVDYRVHKSSSRISSNFDVVMVGQARFLKKHILDLTLRESMYHFGRYCIYRSLSSRFGVSIIKAFQGFALMCVSMKFDRRTFQSAVRLCVQVFFTSFGR